jgi:membrane dipeptidase
MTNPSQILIFDIHVHPSLKVYLFNKKLYRRYPSGGAWNPLFMRVNLSKMRTGNVCTIVSSIYLPERKMIDDCKLMRIGMWLMGILNSKIRRIHKGDPFEVTMEILNHFERAVEQANNKDWPDLMMARSLEELQKAQSAGKTVMIHAVEGAHSLAGNLVNLKKLYDRGVCMLTLAHFYENEATQTVGGIPSDKKFLGCFKSEHEQRGGLSDFGKQVVEEMIKLGILIDMTHCTPQSRKEIFRLNQNRRPLIFSHSGVSALNSHNMNPTDNEIKKIADCGGMIGIIFMNHWLALGEQKNGLELIVKTIKHVSEEGGIDTVAIGSDFDGFTNPPDDIKDAAEYPKLIHALENAGLSSGDIEKIFMKNAMRVFENGWGKIN